MTPIAQSFRSNHFNFTMLDRSGEVALFEKRNPEHSRSFYEVVIIQKRKDCMIEGRTIQAHEAMPPSETWGTCGWSYSDQLRALAAFNTLTTRIARKKTEK